MNVSEHDLTKIPVEEIQKQIELLADETACAASMGDARRAIALSQRSERLKFLLFWRKERDEKINAQEKEADPVK
jgi:hypothetical protein